MTESWKCRSPRPMFKFVLMPAGLLAFAVAAQAEPALTIYNQNFAVIRDALPLNLTAGENRIQASGVTAQVEPDSVVLRDPTGQHPLRMVEQFYRADPISQSYLLSLYEGKEVNFRVVRGDHEEIIKGKVIRSGYQLGSPYNNQGYTQYQSLSGGQPLIEVDGQLRFSLPGEPIFPALPADAILKPTLNWVLNSPVAGPLNAELSYVSRGFNWEADYNIIAPAGDDGTAAGQESLDVNGLVTLSNNSGKTFENATLKLMAGDVNKTVNQNNNPRTYFSVGGYVNERLAAPIDQKNFDEYHLYTLKNRTTLRDQETKQVEFLRAAGVKSESSYVYDGSNLSAYSGYSLSNIRSDENYGTQMNPKVWILRSFANTKENNLGIPLPKGRMRFYRRDASGQLEFIGENVIDHTPEGETVRIYTGNAFDIVGERKRTNFKNDYSNRFVDESFEITLHNHKSKLVEIRVVEHLNRANTWTLTQQSDTSLKKDSNTIEFMVQVPANGEKSVTYSVHYTW